MRNRVPIPVTIALLVFSIPAVSMGDNVQSLSTVTATTTLTDHHPLSCGNYETPLWGWYERLSYMRPATCNCPTGAACHCTTQAVSLIHVLLSECCGTYALIGPITQQFESLAIGARITVCGKLTAPSTWSGFAGDIWVTDWTTEQSFTLSLDPTSITVNRSGVPTTVTVTVNSVGGFSRPVYLAARSLPAGISVSFSSNPVTPPSGGGAVSALSIAASSSALEGTTILTVTGTSDMLTTERSLTLTVASVTTTVSPPPTNHQQTNATLEHDLTNRLIENGTACTYEWGPMFTFYRSGEQFSFNYSSTSPIDVYVFDPDDYSGRVSCTFGPILHAPYGPVKMTGKQDTFAAACLGCEKEGGKGSSFYVLFINRDTAVIPHVTLQVAVKLYPNRTTTATESWCTVVAESYVTVHVADESGKPIPNARVVLNGTFSCQPPPSDPRLNPWGITNSNGDVAFGVLPTAEYNVMVILPDNLQSRTIIVTQITAPRPTFSAKIDIACTPSANRCTIASPKSETQTSSITGRQIDFIDFPAILIAILLGFFVLAKLRRRRD